ncbi:MAG: phytanoyl-CoA dioxygenase family protein [Myxococcota bacterium]
MSWIDDLVADGWVHLPGRCPVARVDAANAAIDESLRNRFDPGQQASYDARSYCPELRRAPVILDLLRAPGVRAALDAVLGWRRLRGYNGQIAIRRAHNHPAQVAPHAHIDGIQSPHNGVTSTSLLTHTVLVGVYLTETPRTFAGNFTVWPGSHRSHAAWFRAQGRAAMTAGQPNVEIGAPKQVMTRPGDLILSHYLTAHAAAVNTSDVERRAIYFRLSLWGLRWNRYAHLIEPWRGWTLAG